MEISCISQVKAIISHPVSTWKWEPFLPSLMSCPGLLKEQHKGAIALSDLATTKEGKIYQERVGIDLQDSPPALLTIPVF